MPAHDLNQRALNSTATTDEIIPHAWYRFLMGSYDKFIAGEEEDSWEQDLEEFRIIQGKPLSLPSPPQSE